MARLWDSLSSAYNLIFNVTQLLGTLIGPISGIYLVAYIFEHKRDIDLVNVYKIDEGKYQYHNGWNIPIIVLFLFMTILIFFAKFVEPLNWLFNTAYVIGVTITGVLYYIYLKIIKK